MSKVIKKTSKSSPTSSENNKKVKVFRYKNVDFKNVKVSDLKKGEGQPLCYINYEDPQTDDEVKLIVQSGTIKLVDHGIPGIHEKFCPTDDKREFIKIPLDNNQPACVELRKHAEQADEYFGSNKMRKQIFKNRADDYQYQPIIRTPQEKDDDDDDNDKKKSKENKVRYDFIKMKFNMIGDKENRVNKTKLIELKGDKKVSVRADTITEVANNIRFLSEIKFIFYYTKVWANTSKPQGGGKKLYGVGFKVMAITYTPSKGKGVNVDDLEFDSDSDDDNEVVEKSPKSKKNKLDDDEEDEDDNKNDNDNNEEEEEEEPVKTSSKKSKHKNEEEDDDDEVEEKPTTKNNKKSTKKPSKKSTKKVVSEEEEEEEEEEEIKPKKRASKNKSPSKNK
ncbi:hypothetical protein [Acanthamoeba polyphaga mimivirus]|uniref:Uncharacterized protein n=4 Tax=Megamimivirinae TaxID=3044648 RepID=A0A2L2DIX2_MIMIV|nr:hypothetical protein MegaChil _gp0370 [Megavirus chiliensis]AFX92411.1 hypothetical protein CE11_00383 [Megavirus courdo11]AUV58312.1 hypothetical protein [Bandra megavirus]AVG46100.1 hypothetical protein [Acanthamoeba polyphaga mimivirus]AEQ32846.1 hypothetical protein [Megavirus chiliensis]AVG47206.1 hypothetical protein [Acanthamoeba polyphaga mimivirus]